MSDAAADVDVGGKGREPPVKLPLRCPEDPDVQELLPGAWLQIQRAPPGVLKTD